MNEFNHMFLIGTGLGGLARGYHEVEQTHRIAHELYHWFKSIRTDTLAEITAMFHSEQERAYQTLRIARIMQKEPEERRPKEKQALTVYATVKHIAEEMEMETDGSNEISLESESKIVTFCSGYFAGWLGIRQIAEEEFEKPPNYFLAGQFYNTAILCEELGQRTRSLHKKLKKVHVTAPSLTAGAKLVLTSLHTLQRTGSSQFLHILCRLLARTAYTLVFQTPTPQDRSWFLLGLGCGKKYTLAESIYEEMATAGWECLNKSNIRGFRSLTGFSEETRTLNEQVSAWHLGQLLNFIGYLEQQVFGTHLIRKEIIQLQRLTLKTSQRLLQVLLVTYAKIWAAKTRPFQIYHLPENLLAIGIYYLTRSQYDATCRSSPGSAELAFLAGYFRRKLPVSNEEEIGTGRE